MNKLAKLSVIALSAILLAGCGSSDSDGEGSSLLDEPVTYEIQNPVTGIFVDSAVWGLNYACSSGATGVTNAQGEFTCESGDSVTFTLGGVVIGTASVQSIVTPHTLFPNNPDAALNLAQVLQTLDTDRNADNGISLDPQLLARIGNMDFTSPSFDEDVQIALGNDIVLVIEAEAEEHLNG